MQFRLTRIAPTPSGYLHLGNILSFAVTATLAEQTGAKILLRIDDLDSERTRDEYVHDIFDTLNFLNIPWHEGPRNAGEFAAKYSQRHRRPLYAAALKKLGDDKLVFACRCSRAELSRDVESGYPGTCLLKQHDLNSDGVNWRLRTNEDALISFFDSTKALKQDYLPAEMRHFVVRRKDGSPSYQLASVVDDVLFGVDLIIRGTDLYPCTLGQLCLAAQLNTPNFQSTAFFHHPLLKTASGDKLSKSAGATSVHYLKNAGATAADVFAAISGLCGMPTVAGDWRALGTFLLRNEGMYP